MGRPEPCVLFAQTFVHPHLDEYVDEVLFAEPIVITACEFLEQNASSASQSVTLVGATSPPSFALEVFVQCEGETRFRRLCQPFLYSHSSSNVLEVEAVVTNHLVVRGSYRSLSLIIYGNTAEDLGQFNIEFDDSSITNLVTSAEGKLEDLPLALHSTDLTIEESISPLKALSLPPLASDISIEAKQFLLLLLKILELPHLGDGLHKIVSSLVSVASSYVSHAWDRCSDRQELQSVISEARKELLELFQHKSRDESAELLVDGRFLESEADLATSKQLVDLLSQYFCFNRESSFFGHHQISKTTNVIMGLSVALLLCSGRESCFHFVNGGGMEQLAHVFCGDMQNSSATTLLLLGVVEQATRHSYGCEGFLGWWPREDENIPPGSSEAYNRLLNLLLQKPRHDVASLATYILHRLRFYEVVLRYECAVLSVLGGLSAVGKATNVTLGMLISAKSQLKKLLKLMNLRGPIEDPSPASLATRSLNLGQTEGLLSYKATNSLIASSHCCFSNWDVDSHLLALLKERGFLPLSVALLSSSSLRSEVGHVNDIFMDIASSIEAIILSLLFCRSGLVFLLQQPELSATVVHALRGSDDVNKDACVPLRYASVLIAKGFFCGPREVGMIIGMHLRVVNAIDRLLTSAPHSEEFLWVLWELCGLARSDCGRQALLALGYFPEAISLLIEALHSAKEPEPVAKNSGALPINLAIFHSAAEIFEVIVTDSTASSLGSWIGHATELHRALHSSSPGSNRKDAPARLLEWIDAGVVYHRNGAIGLLRYAAVLASEGDAHLTTIVSDLTDLENIIGDTTGDSDVNVMENLGKFISEKTFDGVTLRDCSVAQLTIALRILAFISENSAIAAALYDEGAITVIYTVLVNCRFMLERSSNSYDYLVDEGTECNSTSDILLERNREQSLVDLLVPSLVLLINLLQKLQEAEEQHRNTKLMNALLRLHREVSPKLAACAADLSSSYPDAALGFGAICHLVASALACWPVYGWSPGLFHSLLASVQATSMLALGPKETCSLLCLLNDLFPEEGIWLWKKGMPLLSALRTLSIGTLLGPQKEKQINWYLQPLHLEKLLGQLTPQLEKIALVIQHYAISALVVIQDMLRVFVIRIAYQKAESCSVLLRPILSWISGHVSDSCSLSEMDTFKVFKYLDFLASLLEHPHAKTLLVKEGIIQLLSTVLRQSLVAANSDGKHGGDDRNLSKFCFTTLSWCLPVFKSFSLLCDSRTSIQHTVRHDLHNSENLTSEECLLMLAYLLKFCQVLPPGKELLACLLAFKELGSCYEGRSSLAAFYRIHSSFEEAGSQRGHERNGNANYDILSDFEWRKRPPLLCCWKELLRSVDSRDSFLDYSIEAINVLSVGSLCFCVDGKSLKLDQVAAVKFLFGLPGDTNADDGVSEETIDYINKLTSILHSKIAADDYVNYDMQPSLYQALDSAKALALLLQTPAHSVRFDDVFPSGFPVSFDDLIFSKIHLMSDGSAERSEDYLCQGGLGDKFLWDCPETLPDRFPQTTVKRKLPSVEGPPNRRSRGENAPAEITGQNARGLGSSTTPSGPTRRDTFRQRKPNTSRPPSMHVDDYVARERNVDSATNSNVIAVQFSPNAVEEQNFVEESCRVHDVDDEGLFNVAACALLELRDYDPMCIDADSDNVNSTYKRACAWSWEPGNAKNPRMIFCVDTGEFFLMELYIDSDGLKVQQSDCLYKGLPCKAVLWVEGGYVASLVEMGDGMVLKLENERLVYSNPIQNISPILDMSVVNWHDEKQDQMFACCGVVPEGSLRIIRSGISVEKLLKTAPIYQGITGTWTVRMKVSDSYHSFLVLSFVEETRVLSVGLSFIDVTDSVGFQPDVCTLACGLVNDGLLVQIHQHAVRLCLPTQVAHSEGIPLPSPVCTSWFPDGMGINLGAVGDNLIVVSTSSPCFLFILGVRLLSAFHYEIYEMQHLRLHYELSCVSIPPKCFERKHTNPPLNLVDKSCVSALPSEVDISKCFVVGTHKPSVEVLSFDSDKGLRLLAVGTIELTNTLGTAISGCVPQDVRLVLVDRFYVLSGLRNGMLLRFEWPITSTMSSSATPGRNPACSLLANAEAANLTISASNAFGLQRFDVQLSEKTNYNFPITLQLIAIRRIGITPVFLVPLSDSLDADIITLSDRPWLLHTAKHSLSYTSISFQSSTHVTPVCSVECPKGILFVAENSLNLVEMGQSKRLNVQKFSLEGTPRKVLYHSESKLLIVMRTELNNDTCSSDICCVDPLSGTVLSSFKLDLGETGKSMQLVRVGNEQVLIVGTSRSSGPAIMPSGEAESTKGRLIVLCLEHMQNSDSGSTTLGSKAGSSSQRASPFREIVGYATEQLSSSSLCSSPDDNTSCDGIKLEETESWQLRLSCSVLWPGMVLAICPYLDRYFLASAGNAFFVCGFPSDNCQKFRKLAVGRTRFMITSLTAHYTRIAVGDCRDGILFYSYNEEARKLEQLYCDPSQRLVADCILMDVDTAVVSDRKGSIAVLSCSDRLEDNASPECNLAVSCAYYMGEIAMSIRKGSFSYKLPADDALKGSNENIDSVHNTFVASTLLGSIITFIPLSREEYELLEAVQARLIVHRLTAPILGNDHNEYRSRENQIGVPKILDGDMLAQFLELTNLQQEAILSFPLGTKDTLRSKLKWSSSSIPLNEVVRLLERVHYALS